MNKDKYCVGIDISKATFDVYSERVGHVQFTNDTEGFRKFKKLLIKEEWCVMEATGCYHQQLAVYLKERSYLVSVVNPLIVKRYIQMKLRRTKTDKSDAKMIYQYGCNQELEEWEPDPEYVEECKMLIGVVTKYYKHSTMLKNKLHNLNSKGRKTGVLIRSIRRELKHIQKEITVLEESAEQLIREHEGELYTHLLSIPGIGRKTAMLLIAVTDGFRRIEDHRQLTAYLGLAPMDRKSGSSIRGRSRISKVGNPIVRNHLFLCSFTACSCNPQCKALYDRIVAKGKSKKLALIAVCNKLLKQAYGVSKSRMPYDPEYRSCLAC